MRPEVDAQMSAALRHPHKTVVRVEAWRDGQRLDTAANGFPFGLVVLGGEVKLDANAKVRRQINVTVEASDTLLRLLSPIAELRPYRGIRYPDGSTTMVPLGRMEIETQRLGYSPDGTLTLSGGDAWTRIQAAEFLTPASSVLGTRIIDQLSAFLTGAIPSLSVVLDPALPIWAIGSKVWETSRAGAIEEMLSALGAELAFSAEGDAVVRPIPTLGDAVWTVDADSESAVLLSADRDQSVQNTRNVVVVTGSGADGGDPVEPQIVWDNNPLSYTFAGLDPVNSPVSAGPFGVRVHRYSTSLTRGAAEAYIIATALLRKMNGLSRQLSLTAAVNPGLEPGDTIAVRLPTDPKTAARLVERHIVDSVTIPLTPDGVQQIVTRTTGASA